MKVAIVGGKLQGTEAVYLAKLAGFESILIDRNPEVPASGFCDEFVCGDVVAEDEKVIAALKKVDFVLPANENTDVLAAVRRICEREKLKLAFDFECVCCFEFQNFVGQAFLRERDTGPCILPTGGTSVYNQTFRGKRVCRSKARSHARGSGRFPTPVQRPRKLDCTRIFGRTFLFD